MVYVVMGLPLVFNNLIIKGNNYIGQLLCLHVNCMCGGMVLWVLIKDSRETLKQFIVQYHVRVCFRIFKKSHFRRSHVF